MFNLKSANRCWYYDGIEGPPFENCWRLDFYFPGHDPKQSMQAQLFAAPVGFDEDDKKTWNPEQWRTPRLFIERDDRDESGEVRTFYASHAWPLTDDEALALLTSSRTKAVELMTDKIRHVLTLPCETACLD